MFAHLGCSLSCSRLSCAVHLHTCKCFWVHGCANTEFRHWGPCTRTETRTSDSGMKQWTPLFERSHYQECSDTGRCFGTREERLWDAMGQNETVQMFHMPRRELCWDGDLSWFWFWPSAWRLGKSSFKCRHITTVYTIYWLYCILMYIVCVQHSYIDIKPHPSGDHQVLRQISAELIKVDPGLCQGRRER